ncbi:unnamed protein product [Adineta steineri]|uniref:Caveolin n=1 Tax=Adineta steineri TaxID=433720 RepID=A0A814E713_9BILA|nr:unnamed protein product [Adineta steineri]CAF3854496.1 unnamed protein product [Adineta steineri]
MAESYAQKNGIYPTLPTTDTVEHNSRDPYGINKHFQLDFFNVIAEPDRSAYSFDLLHRASTQVYKYSKLFIYRLLTIIFGLPLMLFWGLIIGAYTFLMIWVLAPIRRLNQSLIAEAGIYVQTISDAVIAPLYRSLGQMWSGIRATISTQQIQSTNQIQV